MAAGATVPGTSAGPHGAIYARSGPTKPPSKKGFTAIGTGKGGWIYKPIKTSAPKTGAGKPINWMDPLTRQQIRQQATDTITKAYAPALQQLNQDTKTAQGLDAKRSSDMKYYQSWLQTQMDTLQSHANAAQQTLQNLQTGYTAQQNALYGGQQQGLVDQANQRAGNVSNNADSTTLNGQVGQSQQTSELGLNAAQQQATQGIGLANSQLGAARANDFAVLNATRDKQISDFQAEMTKIGNDRSLLRTKETGDIAKEIARLQGVEIAKAQSNRSYQAAVTKLGIEKANVNSEITTRAENAATAKGRLALDLTKAQLAQMNSDRNYQLNAAKFDSATAKDLYERNHGLGPYRPNRSGQKPALTQQAQNSIYNKIAGVRGQLEQLIAEGHTAEQAWHLIHNGYYIGTRRFAALGDDGLLNAAYNTRTNGGGLTPGDIAYLKSLGLTDPGGRLGVTDAGAAAGESGA